MFIKYCRSTDDKNYARSLICTDLDALNDMTLNFGMMFYWNETYKELEFY